MAESGAHFEDAMKCYERSVTERIRRDTIERNPDLDPEFEARQIAGFEAAIKEDRVQQYRRRSTPRTTTRAAAIATRRRCWSRSPRPNRRWPMRVADLKKILGGGL